MLYTKEMLEVKCANECWRDINWYCIDNAGHIALVSSGAGLIPGSIMGMSEEEWQVIDKYFTAQPPIATHPKFLPSFLAELNSMNSNTQEFNRKRVTEIASRGLYYFDKKEIVNYDDFEYNLYVRPNLPLTLSDIDKDILKVIERTILNIDLNVSDRFYVNEVA